MDSPVYSYLLNHNVEALDPLVANQLGEDNRNAVSVSNIVLINSIEHLNESQEDNASGKLSACVVVIKPN